MKATSPTSSPLRQPRPPRAAIEAQEHQRETPPASGGPAAPQHTGGARRAADLDAQPSLSQHSLATTCWPSTHHSGAQAPVALSSRHEAHTSATLWFLPHGAATARPSNNAPGPVPGAKLGTASGTCPTHTCYRLSTRPRQHGRPTPCARCTPPDTDFSPSPRRPRAAKTSPPTAVDHLVARPVPTAVVHSTYRPPAGVGRCAARSPSCVHAGVVLRATDGELPTAQRHGPDHRTSTASHPRRPTSRPVHRTTPTAPIHLDRDGRHSWDLHHLVHATMPSPTDRRRPGRPQGPDHRPRGQHGPLDRGAPPLDGRVRRQLREPQVSPSPRHRRSPARCWRRPTHGVFRWRRDNAWSSR